MAKDKINWDDLSSGVTPAPAPPGVGQGSTPQGQPGAPTPQVQAPPQAKAGAGISRQEAIKEASGGGSKDVPQNVADQAAMQAVDPGQKDLGNLDLVADTVAAPLAGATDYLEGAVNLGSDISKGVGHIVSQATATQYSPDGTPIVAPSDPKADHADLSGVKPEVATGVGKVVEGISSFTLGMIGAGKLLKAAGILQGAGKAVAISRTALEAGGVGATVMDPYDERVSNLLSTHPSLIQPVANFLKADPEDGAAEARLKSGLENAGLGALADTALVGVMKAYKWAKVAMARTPGDAPKIVQQLDTEITKAAEPPVVPKPELANTKSPDAGSKSPETTPAAVPEEKTPVVAFTLPKNLAGAKPGFSYGNKSLKPQFESDLDKAAYILANNGKSAKHDLFAKAVTDAGYDLDEVKAHGKEIAKGIKAQAKGAEDGAIIPVKAADFKGNRAGEPGNPTVAPTSPEAGATVSPGTTAEPGSVPVPEAKAEVPAGARADDTALNDEMYTKAKATIPQETIDKAVAGAQNPASRLMLADVPYGGGTSKDGTTIYLDKGIPDTMTAANGKEFNPRLLVAYHERVEHSIMRAMGDKVTYQEAHQIALQEEKKYAESQGIDWASYDSQMQPILAKILADKKGLSTIPADLDPKPYVDEGDKATLANTKSPDAGSKSPVATPGKAPVATPPGKPPVVPPSASAGAPPPPGGSGPYVTQPTKATVEDMANRLMAEINGPQPRGPMNGFNADHIIPAENVTSVVNMVADTLAKGLKDNPVATRTVTAQLAADFGIANPKKLFNSMMADCNNMAQLHGRVLAYRQLVAEVGQTIKNTCEQLVNNKLNGLGVSPQMFDALCNGLASYSNMQGALKGITRGGARMLSQQNMDINLLGVRDIGLDELLDEQLGPELGNSKSPDPAAAAPGTTPVAPTGAKPTAPPTAAPGGVTAKSPQIVQTVHQLIQNPHAVNMILAAAGNPAKQMVVLGKVGRSMWAKANGVLNEWCINAMLSLPSTFVKIAQSSGGLAIGHTVETFLGAAAAGDSATAKLMYNKGMDTLFARWKLLGESLSMGTRAFSNGYPVLETAAHGGIIPHDLSGDNLRIPYDPTGVSPLLGDAAGFISRLGFGLGGVRSHMGLDEVLRNNAYMAELHGNAMRDADKMNFPGGRSNPNWQAQVTAQIQQGTIPVTHALRMVESGQAAGLKNQALADHVNNGMIGMPGKIDMEALQVARETTLSLPLDPNGIAAKVQRINDQIPVLGVLNKFIRLSANALGYVGRRVPGVNLAFDDIRKTILEGGEEGAKTRGKAAFGAFLTGTAFTYACSGRITGGDPSLPSAQRYCILNDDGSATPYRNMAEPMTTFLSEAADTMSIVKYMGEGDVSKLFGAAVEAGVRNLTSQSWAEGNLKMLEGLADPQKHGQDLLNDLASVTVPSSWKVLGQNHVGSTDDLKRDVHSNSVWGSMLNTIMSKIPGESNSLPPLRNIMGQTQQLPPGSRPGDFHINPQATREGNPDPVGEELTRLTQLGAKFPMPPRRASEPGASGVDLTPKEYDQMMNYVNAPKGSGGVIPPNCHELLLRLIHSDHYLKHATDGDADYPGSKVMELKTILSESYHKAMRALIVDNADVRKRVQMDRQNTVKAKQTQDATPQKPSPLSGLLQGVR